MSTRSPQSLLGKAVRIRLGFPRITSNPPPVLVLKTELQHNMDYDECWVVHYLTAEGRVERKWVLPREVEVLG